MRVRFRPLAGLSCINLDYMCEQGRWEEVKFPSPRGVELHKPIHSRTLGGNDGTGVSVPSRG